MTTPARLVLTAYLGLFAASFASAKTLIHAGALIDGQSDTVRKNVTVVVSGERIEAIQDGFTAPAIGDTVIDLKSSTLMPGLMDMHVHLDGQQSPESYTEEFFLNPGDYALRAAFYAKKTLLAVSLFEWLAAANPRSANAQDSLAEALEAAGETTWAQAAARRALELLPGDGTLTEQQRQGIQQANRRRVEPPRPY